MTTCIGVLKFFLMLMYLQFFAKEKNSLTLKRTDFSDVKSDGVKKPPEVV